MTTQEALEMCRNLRVGDIVTINKTVRSEEGKEPTVAKTKGKILGRYPHLLLIGVGEGYKQKVSYTYTEIATTKCIEKKRRGRPSKV